MLNDIIANFEPILEQGKFIISNDIPIEARNIHLRKQRYFTENEKKEIKGIFEIVKSDIPFISLLPYQKTTIDNPKDLFEVKELLWYNHSKNLLYQIKNGMYVYMNFTFIDKTNDFEENFEPVNIFVNENLGSIIKYAMSNKTYLSYLNHTEEKLVDRNVGIRYDKDHDDEKHILYVLNNIKSIDYEPINKFNFKLKNIKDFDVIHWCHLNLYNTENNYILFQHNKHYYLCIFNHKSYTKFDGEISVSLNIKNSYVSSEYKNLINILSEKEYEIYLNDTKA